jgi:transposase
VLLEHCSHARFVWNLAVEQHRHWRPGRATWRKAGVHEGFRIVGRRGDHWDVCRLSRKTGQVRIPKVGWVRFRWSRHILDRAKSFRVKRDRAGRWHVCFAVIPPPISGPGTGEVVGVDRGVAVSAALSTGELLSVPGLGESEAKRLLRLQRRLARAKRGSNRRTRIKTAIGRLRARQTDRRKDWVEQTSTCLARRFDPGRVEKIDPACTSQACHACGHREAENRESQAVFRCRACGHTDHADVNAAENIAAGRAVTARGALQPSGGATNREPQPVLPSA